MMEIQNQPQFDWANDAFVALNNHNMQADKWAQMNNQSFTIPPSLLSQASTIERYGQVTPPEDRSPVTQPQEAREGSIPVEQLRNEPLLPQQDKIQQEENRPSPKRRRTSRQTTANQSQGPDDTPLDHDANPQPPKRKRGRPKSQPQMVEAFTAEGFPFQVSSARQSHLEKNRVAAHKCRQRKKEYINGLEGRARDFSAKNKALKANVAMLREEVLGLKNEVLRHAGCGFWAVDEYLARCAGDLLGMEAPGIKSSTQSESIQHSPMMDMDTLEPISRRHDSLSTIYTQGIHSESSPESDEFGGLELLEDFDEEMDMDMEMHQ